MPADVPPLLVTRSVPSGGLAHRALAELVGTAFLLMAVVGGGIAAARLSADPGVQLLAAAVVTGAALTAVILALGRVSGAHLNPVVSVADRLLGGIATRELAVYVAAQMAGAVLGTVLANLMFDLPAITVATTSHGAPGPLLGEVVATLGLLLVIFGVARSGATWAVAPAVGAYITAAYFSTHAPLPVPTASPRPNAPPGRRAAGALTNVDALASLRSIDELQCMAAP